jgi:hypothetical protein
MSEWSSAGLTWGEAVERIHAAVKAEEAEFLERHGLRGVYALQLDIAVMVGQTRGEVIRLGEDMFGGIASVAQLAESQAPDARALGEGLGVHWLKAVDDLLKETTVSGFAAPAAMPVTYQRYAAAGVEAVRFEMPPEMDFGPNGQMPITHHLLSVALGIREAEGLPRYLFDRNVLQGAW